MKSKIPAMFVLLLTAIAIAFVVYTFARIITGDTTPQTTQDTEQISPVPQNPKTPLIVRYDGTPLIVLTFTGILQIDLDLMNSINEWDVKVNALELKHNNRMWRYIIKDNPTSETTVKGD